MSKTDYIAVAEYLATQKAPMSEFNDLFESLAYDESINDDEYCEIYDKMMQIFKASF